MDYKLALIQKVENCFRDAEIFFERKLSRPKVLFNIRGQDAGRAYFPVQRKSRKPLQVELRFNEKLLERNPEEFINKVVPHECAHLIVYELFGTKIKPHGEEWKAVMEGLFGVKADITHDFDTEEIVNKPYIYSCACENRKIAFTPRQHKQMQKGSQYICRACRSEVHFLFERQASVTQKKADYALIKGLFVFQQSNNIVFDDVLQTRLNYILNRKKPSNVFSSGVLDPELFKNWLRMNSLIRKYKGDVMITDLPDLIEQDLVSHVILVVDDFEDVREKHSSILEELNHQGIITRTLRY